CGAGRERRIGAKEIAVVLQVRTTTGGIDDDGIKALPCAQPDEPPDEPGCERTGLIRAPQMMHERAAAPLDHGHLPPGASEQTQAGRTSVRRHHALRAAPKERDAAASG